MQLGNPNAFRHAMLARKMVEHPTYLNPSTLLAVSGSAVESGTGVGCARLGELPRS